MAVSCILSNLFILGIAIGIALTELSGFGGATTGNTVSYQHEGLHIYPGNQTAEITLVDQQHHIIVAILQGEHTYFVPSSRNLCV